jgi:hypothetical protein
MYMIIHDKLSCVKGINMKYLEPKASTSTKFYTLDYSKQFGNDTIIGVTTNITAGTVLITKLRWLNSTVGLMLSGGVDGETFTCDISITTAAGQQLTDTITMFVIASESDVDYSVITKQQIVQWAFEDIRLAGYTFDHTPNELASMLSRLDGLMREYRLRSINVGYNHPKTIGSSNLNDIAGFEDGLGLSIATLLAESFMDGMGKSYTPSFIAKKNRAWNFVYAYCAAIPNRSYDKFTPRGAGQKFYNTLWPFLGQQAGSDAIALLNNMQGQYIGAGIWDESIWG